MNLQVVNGSTFVNDFIGNLAKIADTGIVKIKKDKLSCITATGDNTIITYSEYTRPSADDDTDTTLNIPDFKKLHRLLCLLEQETFTLKVDANSISYTSDDIKFKMHLYDDGILASPSVNVDKINSISISSIFDIKLSEIRSLAKSSFLLPDIQKIYFTFKDGKVYGEVTDKSQHNVDSFSKLLTEKISGVQINKTIPVSIEVLRLLTSVKTETITAKFSNDLGILIFDVKCDNLFTKYIVSSLVN